jgi:hypothetical protein
MSETSTENGHANGRVYVKFGPGATQEMPIEWAEIMLTEWREKNAKQFGAALASAATESGR